MIPMKPDGEVDTTRMVALDKLPKALSRETLLAN